MDQILDIDGTDTAARLIGRADKSLDEKNRLVIPSSFRKALGSGELILTRWFDEALALFQAPVWHHLADAIHRSSGYSRPERHKHLTFFHSAVKQSMDNQGRIVLNGDMKEYAGIDSEAVLLGDWDKIQIWSPHRYKDFRKKDDVSFDEEFEQILTRATTRSDPKPYDPAATAVPHQARDEEAQAENDAT